MDNFNSKSLMIGDWVVYNGDTEYSGPIRVEGMDIATDSLITSDRDDVGFNGVWPIPLTPEILEKNGWGKCNIDVVDDDEQYGCAYDSFYFTWWRKVKLLGCYFEDKNVGLHYEMISELSTKYIHELQHALKLCGIEKEIEL